MKVSEIFRLDETTEENQIINLVADRLVDRIVAMLATKPKWHDFLTNPSLFSNFSKITWFGVKLKDLRLPKIDSKILNAVINDLSIRVNINPEKTDTVASYGTGSKNITVNLLNVERFAKHENTPILKYLQSILIHEIQHAIDDFKSNGKAFDSQPGSIDKIAVSRDDYLKYPHEVNARFTQALLDIQDMLDEGKTVKDAINISFRVNELNGKYVKDINRLMSRAYKFFDAHTKNPKRIKQGNLIAKAKAWILGNSNETIQ